MRRGVTRELSRSQINSLSSSAVRAGRRKEFSVPEQLKRFISRCARGTTITHGWQTGNFILYNTLYIRLAESNCTVRWWRQRCSRCACKKSLYKMRRAKRSGCASVRLTLIVCSKRINLVIFMANPELLFVYSVIQICLCIGNTHKKAQSAACIFLH